MKIVIAPDKFRGSLSAIEVANAMAEGVMAADQNIEIIKLPMADGGEDTAAILTQAASGHMIDVQVQNPLFRSITAQYGISGNGKQAFIEMASASGLSLLAQHERNPLFTSTFGTGQMIADALERGVNGIILCIGGSATNDAGIGMATALGYRFLDNNNQTLSPIGNNLTNIKHIDNKGVTPLLYHTKITVACDVSNPFYGPNGAAYIYAPQKGADAEAVEALDKGLRNISQIIENQNNISLQGIAGSGAAGGLGGGCVAFLNATLQSGIKTVMEAVDFETKIKNADLILTGEGKIDEQTLNGKLIAGIAEIAQKQQIPVVALCGTLLLANAHIRQLGLQFATSILRQPMTLAEAIGYAYTGVRECTEAIVRFLNSQKKP